MTSYELIAWCDRAFYTRFKVEAETPEQALEIGKQQAENEPAEECDHGYYWDTFEVCDSDDSTVLTYQDEQARLCEAAPQLLAAIEAGRSKSWVHNAAITDDIEALRRIALEQCDWWNNIAWPLIERLKGETA